MSKYINIHTHSYCKNSNICIKNIAFLEELTSTRKENEFYSVGLHPWDISEINLENYLIAVKKKLSTKNTLLLGEIGLDRAILTDFSLQKRIFVEQLLLAESLKMPALIHCVRSYSDILEILKKEKITIPLIFHDFRASKQTFNQLNKYESYFSFGNVLFSANAKVLNYFTEIPLERLFFETDNSDIAIENVYLQASKLRNIDIEELKKRIELNFRLLQF